MQNNKYNIAASDLTNVKLIWEIYEFFWITEAYSIFVVVFVLLNVLNPATFRICLMHN